MSRKRVDSLRLCWLEAFLAVIDNGGDEARAAENMGLSGAIITHYIVHLEKWVRTPLFNGDFPKHLTDYGKQFEGVARSVVDQLSNARSVPKLSDPQPILVK